MGFDVYGKAPKSDLGRCFTTSVWAWRPLWIYCLTVAPEIAGKVKRAQSNDGDGLDAGDALALGEVLAASVQSGLAEGCAGNFRATVIGLPDEVCFYCDGSGIRTDTESKRECNVCKGTGKVRPAGASYRFNVGPVEEFAAFCCASGGFEIW